MRTIKKAIAAQDGLRVTLGDAVMALWGADKTHDTDPENAIRAAELLGSYCINQQIRKRNKRT